MPASTPTGSPPVRELHVVGTVVDRRIGDLQNGLFRTEYRSPAAVAALARLRRGAGKPAGTVLDVLEFTVSDEFWFGDERNADDSAVTRRYENACHLAMTLWAVHQQSRGDRMHRRGRGLGAALRLLEPADTVGPVAQRFRMLGTAESFEELGHHLRGVAQLLRARSAPLDYGLLADELVRWQAGDRSRVQLAWGRGFYRTGRPRPSDPASSDPASSDPAADAPQGPGSGTAVSPDA